MKIQWTPGWLFLTCFLLTLLACTTPASDDIRLEPAQKGTVSGRATDAAGKPLAHATIVINNTQFYNHNILGQTDANGHYKLALMPGSWYVRGTTKIRFDNKNYVLDLHPDSDAAFAGTEGVLRNLSLKIAGARTGQFGNDGYYGGQVEVFAWGLATEQITLTLQPVGTLVDDSIGRTITAQLRQGYLDDVPLGKYTITAKRGNQPLLVRIRNAEQVYAKSVTASFDAAYAGAEGRYKLDVEVTE
jgi:5-hydroxyisourate hydrolase-like protein (transthyretin family)